MLQMKVSISKNDTLDKVTVTDEQKLVIHSHVLQIFSSSGTPPPLTHTHITEDEQTNRKVGGDCEDLAQAQEGLEAHETISLYIYTLDIC